MRSPREPCDRDRGLADDHGPSDTRRPVEREPQREQSAERVPHERDLVDVEAVEHAGDDVDRLLTDGSALPEVRRRQAVTREIDEQMAVSGQTAGERRHPDPGRRDAVDEHHRIAGARLEDTDSHGRRRDVDPTLLYVDPVRGGDPLFGRPQPRLDPHGRASYARRGSRRRAGTPNHARNNRRTLAHNAGCAARRDGRSTALGENAFAPWWIVLGGSHGACGCLNGTLREMAELPSGTVTFLFTDLVDSTRLWDEQPELMRASLARHDELLRGAVVAHAGHVVKGTGDGLHAVFASVGEALFAAAEMQSAILGESRDGPVLSVRVGIHSGEAQIRDGDYFGTVVNRSAAHRGGRTRRPDLVFGRDG